MKELNNEEVLKIIEKHKKYFRTGETRNIDFRLSKLNELKKVIKENESLILEALKKDLNKSEFDGYASEIGYLYDSIKYFTKNLRKLAKVKKVKTPLVHFGSKSYVYSEPYGVVLIIGPFNYPFQLIFEPLIGAIIAGNCAVIKPSEFTPNVTKVVEKVIKETFEEEYVSVVQGARETTSALINSPFDYIFFTGSVPVGKIVMEAAAKNLVPVTLELGGKSPCIVDKEVDLHIAAQRIVWGKFMNAGQTCVAPDYLLVHKQIKAKLIDKILEQIELFYGIEIKTSNDFGRIVNERQFDRLVELIDEKKVVFGGRTHKDTLYIEPTIMDNVTLEDKVMEDEIFGPILPILEYNDLEEVIDMVNSKPKPLALYLFTENKEVESKVIENVSYGGGCINDTMTHLVTPYLPFGGVGNSGMGSYHGVKSFETFSHKKSVLKKSTKINMKFIFPPYTKEKVSLLRKVMK
ncbi:aldehyde dehydrogenase [Clostridium paridis]|uniref:Aldehyde dehydrogenase n=1 Tax=Clostridium paridis TaxID=2803863 RepID=A0A937FK95_9CLOT|nr:aldehyde dehydrogenase [Clostridium paridis]MBL4934098.1 aldehyde dehydrogenase [Clostridium paridis]